MWSVRLVRSTSLDFTRSELARERPRELANVWPRARGLLRPELAHVRPRDRGLLRPELARVRPRESARVRPRAHGLLRSELARVRPRESARASQALIASPTRTALATAPSASRRRGADHCPGAAARRSAPAAALAPAMPHRRSALAVRRRPSSGHYGASICRCCCARSGDPVAFSLRRRGADRCPGTAAPRSAAAATRAPAALPPFHSGSAAPTDVLVPRGADLPLPLCALRPPCCSPAPAARCRQSSRCHSALISCCHCARSGDPAAVPLWRRGAERRPGAAERRSAAAAARAPATNYHLRAKMNEEQCPRGSGAS